MNNKYYKYLIIKKFKKKNLLNLIYFIIIISNKKLNNFLHILDSIGHELIFYSTGDLNIKKKNTNKIEILQSFLKILINNLKFINKRPLIIHFININFTLNWFIKKILKKIYLINIKTFILFSFNGCRKKKL